MATASNAPRPYCGRFAPSPSGPLHLGSLATALGSYFDAKAHAGLWLLRIEDIDPPREQVGASELILTALAAHGLISSEPTFWQHQHTERYQSICNSFLALKLAFYCDCSRQQQDHRGRCVNDCQSRALSPTGHNLRVQLLTTDLDFTDRIHGPITAPIESFDNAIIWRKNGLPSYLLAVVADDIAAGITHVVRGEDLLHDTHRQIALYRLLNAAPPRYAHLPLVTHADGHKLSKQTGAAPIDPTCATMNVRQALSWLRPDWDLPGPDASLNELLAFGLEHWSLPE